MGKKDQERELGPLHGPRELVEYEGDKLHTVREVLLQLGFAPDPTLPITDQAQIKAATSWLKKQRASELSPLLMAGFYLQGWITDRQYQEYLDQV
jgi:hypothetical protein